MANREHEMLFKLGAQLGQNFSGTFASAQQVLTATQKKVQELNRLQSDIGAYQRQQSGIEKSNQKLELYKSQLANTQRALDTVRKEIEANGTASAELAAKESELSNKELALKNRIRDTENAITDKNNRLKQMGEGLASAGVNTDKLSEKTQRLGNEMATLRAQEERAANEANNFGNTALQTFDAVGSALVASGIATGLKKIYDGFSDCVLVASEFEATMSTVEALSGANAQQMDTLSEKAKELGATTVFTANQSAEAMTYMGMAGWKAEEMLSGMNGVMALASASGEDLGLVSDIVTDNLTAFGLKAKDTAHFADVLAAAATNSNTSVAIMGETFSGSAAIAGALGYSIEDVAVAVGEMANAGVKGSIAGTALKNMFNGLLSGVTLTGKAFGEYEFTAVNVDGTMKGFAETIDELRVYFDQMTESERVNNAMAIAGQRGYNGLLAILNTTEEDYRKLSDTINNCSGAAQRMADIKLDNLSGDVTLLKSAADGLKMSVGELYRVELRKLAQIATSILGDIQEFIKTNPNTVKAILSFVGGISAVVGALTVLNTIKKARNAIDTISAALRAKNAVATAAETAAIGANTTATVSATAAQNGLNAAMSANPVGLLIAGIGILGGVLASAMMSYESAIPAVEELTEKAREFNSAMEEANEDYENTKIAISSNADTADFYIDKLEEIEKATGGNIDANEEYHNILSLLSRTVPELANYIDLETNSIEGGTEALRKHTEAYRKDAEEQARQEFINSVYDKYGEVIKEVSENKIKLTQAQIKEEQSLAKAQKTQERMNAIMAEAERLADGKIDATSFLTDEYFELETALHEYQIEAGLAVDEQENLTKAIEKGEQTIASAKEEVDLATEIVEKAAGSVKESADITTTLYSQVDEAIATVTEETENLITAYYDAYNAAYSSVSGQYALWDTAATVVPTSISTINSSISSQIDYWDKYNQNLETLAKRSESIEGLSDVIAGFADGGKESVNAIAGMANASDEELKKMVESYAKLKEEQDKTAQSLADVKTDFDTKMDEISQKMADTVSEMKLDDESRAAAKMTIEAYADAILAGKGKVVEAADAVKAATTSALAGLNSDGSPQIFVTPSSDGGPAMVPYYGVGKKYASGTDYAESGFALVGEEGPEIVYMHGGEKVIDAENTRAIMGGGQNNTITISPQIVINNSGGEIDEAQVSDLSERLISNVMDALEEAGINRKRSAYA